MYVCVFVCVCAGLFGSEWALHIQEGDAHNHRTVIHMEPHEFPWDYSLCSHHVPIICLNAVEQNSFVIIAHTKCTKSNFQFKVHVTYIFLFLFRRRDCVGENKLCVWHNNAGSEQSKKFLPTCPNGNVNLSIYALPLCVSLKASLKLKNFKLQTD